MHVSVKVAAYLNPSPLNADSIPSDRGQQFWMSSLNNGNASNSAGNIHDRPIDQTPYWHIERARIGNTREVPVELGDEWEAGGSKKYCGRRSRPGSCFDVTSRAEQLAGGADSGLVAHQSHLRVGRRKTHSRIATECPMVSGGRQPMLDAEGSEDFQRRSSRGESSL